MTFELRIERAGVVVPGAPLLSGSDLVSANAVTKSAWYVLSGSHKSSKIVLTIKRTSLDHWLNDIGVAARRGDRIAIVVDGKTVGTMVVMQIPTGANFEIDAAFISTGTESERASAVRNLAAAIRKSIR